MSNIESTKKFFSNNTRRVFLVLKIIILLLYSNLFVFYLSVSLQLQRKTIILYCEENVHWTWIYVIFKTTNVRNLAKVIQESPYGVLQVTSKKKTLKTIRLLFKGSWILSYFWHSYWHYFGYISRKIEKLHFLESPQRSFSKHTDIHINRATYYERTVF